MSRPRKKRLRRPRVWRWVLTLRLRWARSWTSWRLRRATRSQQREISRHRLLLLSLDNSLLRQKELATRAMQLQHRLWEMEQARQYRMEGVLPPETPGELTQDLDSVLGLSTPPL